MSGENKFGQLVSWMKYDEGTPLIQESQPVQYITCKDPSLCMPGAFAWPPHQWKVKKYYSPTPEENHP